jgi:hypothetical protein
MTLMVMAACSTRAVQQFVIDGLKAVVDMPRSELAPAMPTAKIVTPLVP